MVGGKAHFPMVRNFAGKAKSEFAYPCSPFSIVLIHKKVIHRSRSKPEHSFLLNMFFFTLHKIGKPADQIQPN